MYWGHIHEEPPPERLTETQSDALGWLKNKLGGIKDKLDALVVELAKDHDLPAWVRRDTMEHLWKAQRCMEDGRDYLDGPG